MEKILPRRMSTSPTACSFASHFCQEMAQNADLPLIYKNFSGVTPPTEPPPCDRTQGCSVNRLLLFWLTQLSDSSRAPEFEHKLLQFELNSNFIYAVAANKLCPLNPSPLPFDHLSSKWASDVNRLVQVSTSVCHCSHPQTFHRCRHASTDENSVPVPLLTKTLHLRHKFDPVWMLKLYPQHSAWKYTAQ